MPHSVDQALVAGPVNCSRNDLNVLLALELTYFSYLNLWLFFGFYMQLALLRHTSIEYVRK